MSNTVTIHITVKPDSGHVKPLESYRVVVHARDGAAKYPLHHCLVDFFPPGKNKSPSEIRLPDSETRDKRYKRRDVVAVFLTLLRKVECGWVEHGRAAWHAGLTGFCTRDLKLRGVEGTWGRVTFTVHGVKSNTDLVFLTGDYFVATKEQKTALAEEARKSETWFQNVKPSVPVLDKVHMALYDNAVKELPGWTFLQCEPEDEEAEETYEHVFRCATRLLGHRPERVEWAASEESFLMSVLGVGLQLFGASVSYLRDYRVANGAEKRVESFSCNAREDGVGDCEDIAFEKVSVAGEFGGREFGPPMLGALAAVAAAFDFGLCLGIMSNGETTRQAHAYVVAVRRGDGVKGPRDVMVMDGVRMRYPLWNAGADGSPPRIPGAVGLAYDTDGSYAHFVTLCFKCPASGEGANGGASKPETYFRPTKTETYGSSLRGTFALRPTTQVSPEALAAAREVVLANRPFYRAPPGDPDFPDCLPKGSVLDVGPRRGEKMPLPPVVAITYRAAGDRAPPETCAVATFRIGHKQIYLLAKEVEVQRFLAEGGCGGRVKQNEL